MNLRQELRKDGNKQHAADDRILKNDTCVQNPTGMNRFKAATLKSNEVKRNAKEA